LFATKGQNASFVTLGVWAFASWLVFLYLRAIWRGRRWAWWLQLFFGAGERMAQLATAGSWRPTLITSGIVLVLATWSFYALSGAGVIPRLPLVRTALCIITGIYLLRGVAGFPVAASSGSAFWWWSSAICLTIGLVHLIGTRQAWAQLSSGAA
jgi:hypothetical protein